MKVGLVLEGGAMRGMYTAGVIDVLLENNIKVDGIIGVSAGALFGVNYCSKQKERVLRYQKKYIKHKNYMGISTLLKTGNIINNEIAFDEIPFKTDIFDEEEFQKSKTDFQLVITNIKTGQPEYIKITNTKEQMKYFIATSAMPYVSKIVEIGNDKYLDGALADSIPIKKMESMGYDKIIVVLTKPQGYKKKKHSPLISKLKYKKYPELQKAINTRYLHYNETIDYIDEKEKDGEIIVLRPSRKVKMSRIENDIKKLQEMYDLGVEDTKNNLDKIRNFIGNKQMKK